MCSSLPMTTAWRSRPEFGGMRPSYLGPPGDRRRCRLALRRAQEISGGRSAEGGWLDSISLNISFSSFGLTRDNSDLIVQLELGSRLAAVRVPEMIVSDVKS